MTSTNPHSQRARERYQTDPEYRARTCAYQAEYRRRRYAAEPEFRAKTRASSVRYLEAGDNREAIRVRKRAAHVERFRTDPEYAAKWRRQRREYNQRPAIREKRRLESADRRARLRAAALAVSE